MSRPLFLSLLIFVLLFAGLAGLNSAVLALTIPLLLYLFYGFWRGPEELKLDVHRELSAERVAPNTPVKVKVTLINRGGDLEELELEDVISPALTISNGSNRHSISLPKGGIFTFEYNVHAPRGNYPFETLRAGAADCFGIVSAAESFHTQGQIFVFPPVTRLKYIAIRPRRTRVYAGSIPARVGGTGVEFFGVRDYQPGDSPRRINWHVSARHEGSLYSNEFQQERVADVGIVLDGRERANLFFGGKSLFEHSVLAAAALSNALLTQGNRVGLLIYGHYLQWTLPGYGKLQRERILHALARATPGPSQIFEGLEFLPVRAFPPESQIVLVSPVLENDFEPLIQLRARGYQVLIVSPDSVAFEQNLLPHTPEVQLAARVVRMERKILIHRLMRAGIQLIEWNISQPLDQALGQALRYRPTGNRL